METKGGNPIRILAWDLPSDFPIATAEFTKDNRVIVESYSVDGWVGYGEKENNLFIVTSEEELSEFEKACMKLYNEGRDDGLSGDKLSNESVKESASELLALAKQQLLQSGEFLTQEHHEKLMDTLREECTKDLPRWKPAARAYDGDRLPRIDWSLNRLVARFEEVIFYLDINDLYKLPGFKED